MAILQRSGDAINKIKNVGDFPGYESFADALLEIFGIFLKYHDDYRGGIYG